MQDEDIKHWDVVSKAADFKGRLARLTRHRLLVFSLSCVTHARDHVLSVADSAGADPAPYLRAGMTLNNFWDRYPESVQPSALLSLCDQAEELLGDEDTPFEPGEVHLLDGIYYALMSGRDQKVVSHALSASINAFEAVFFIADFAEDLENEAVEIDGIDADCVDEMRFQVSLLELLESCDEPVPDYQQLRVRIR